MYKINKHMYKEIDKYNYKGWLNSDSFIKRVIAVNGYFLTGQLLLLFIASIVTFILVSNFI